MPSGGLDLVPAIAHEEFGSFQKALGRLKKLDPNHKLRKAFRADAACQAL